MLRNRPCQTVEADERRHVFTTDQEYLWLATAPPALCGDRRTGERAAAETRRHEPVRHRVPAIGRPGPAIGGAPSRWNPPLAGKVALRTADRHHQPGLAGTPDRLPTRCAPRHAPGLGLRRAPVDQAHPGNLAGPPPIKPPCEVRHQGERLAWQPGPQRDPRHTARQERSVHGLRVTLQPDVSGATTTLTASALSSFETPRPRPCTPQTRSPARCRGRLTAATGAQRDEQRGRQSSLTGPSSGRPAPFVQKPSDRAQQPQIRTSGHGVLGEINTEE